MRAGKEPGRMKDYKYIFFDLDGTLSDSSEGIISCVKHTLSGFGISEEREDVLRGYIGPPLKERFIELYGVNDVTAEAMMKRYREKYEREGAYQNVLYPGIRELLLALRESGRVTGVATSKPEDTSIDILRHFGILDLFDYVCGAEKHGPRVRKDQVLLELFKRAGIGEKEKGEAVLIGDTSYDIEGAKKTGIDAIGVSYGFGDPEKMAREGAVAVAASPEELKIILVANAKTVC